MWLRDNRRGYTHIYTHIRPYRVQAWPRSLSPIIWISSITATSYVCVVCVYVRDPRQEETHDKKRYKNHGMKFVRQQVMTT